MASPRLPVRLSLLLAALVPSPSPAQVKASEPASVSQTVDGTKLTITYSRPRHRSRDSLFGKVVKWDEVWTPGANLATTLEVSKPVKLDGHPVPKGKYSVWMVVRRSGDWTFVLDPRSDLYHEAHPDSTAQQIRFPVHTMERPFAEVLTWSFPQLGMSDLELAMQWGTTYVEVKVDVEPTYSLGFPAGEAGPYLGRYDYRMQMPGDTVGKSMELVVTHEDGRLLARWIPAPFPEWSRFVLIRIKDDWFIPGFLDEQGQLWEVMKEMVIEFNVASGRATGFDVRSEDDKVMATGKRKS